MSRAKNYSTGVKRRRYDRETSTRQVERVEPWAEGTVKELRQGNSMLVCVNNPDNSENARRWLDDQLAKIAVMQSEINVQTNSGKEIGALKDLVSLPPYTFSEVFSFYRGAVVSLVQSWEEDGMPTLGPISIFPPESEEESRIAVLYGIGNPDDLNSLETAFLDYFRPMEYAKCFREQLSDQEGISPTTKFFVQWELFNDEAALALGVSTDSPEFYAVTEQLERQAESIRESRNGKQKKHANVRGAPLIGSKAVTRRHSESS